MDLPVYLLDIDENGETEVDYIALVDKPAVQLGWKKFSDDKRLQFEIQDEEERIISGVLMLADKPIYRNDEEGEYYVMFTKDTIKKIAQKFFEKGYQSNVNLMHDSGQRVEGLTMFESFITDEKRGIQPMKAFEDVPDGSWFGSFKVNNDEVWEKIKSGEFTGYSVEGLFQYKRKEMRENLSEEQILERIKELLRSI